LFFCGTAAFTACSAPSQAIFLAPTLLHDLAVGGCFLLRKPLRRQALGLQPRVLAYGCTFLVPAFVTAAARLHPEWIANTGNKGLAVTGFSLWLLGTLLAVWTVWILRPAFSLVPQARVLVTRGPFRFARHPIYASYVLQYFGFWLLHPSWTLAGVLLLWTVLMLLRVRAEEDVLSKSFPEYAAYRERVPRFGIRLPKSPSGIRPSRKSPDFETLSPVHHRLLGR
jgi:protein-S-isoprenylcysteine O-methyltransferase Ste14